MCRCMGWVQPPPPLLMPQVSPEPTHGVQRGLVGWNYAPLIRHSVTPRRPHLELVLEDRLREEASADRDLGPLQHLGAHRGHLLARGDLAEVPLALLPGERHRGAGHEPQAVLAGDRRAEEAEAVPARLD